ncbi:rho GTPase-activating protein 32 isoform X1 [Synchiropus splendidus]|uniref:rho GTPase-activating protein 32 isoform X1 n=3 Tax=Synchiropus splendidus TaxID=270530 RepID=UPI00237E262A|nr:rho GTPase-activating protein 32 isoform X1 [Synchiropus splendidus]XP_053702615.1 rho GTPase-activating protein 32 isoform X1 [Synchiropus splendidus]XP_053702616.1 rho GTPase-activating protein 32 isoform X1 [Synchiropus splendidus]XP_053702617.1 rho GTPase-activating protein 32 isoform X1 [Synchiropus splendidus]
MEAGSGAAAAVGSAALGLLGATATSSHDILDRGLRPGRHLEDDDIVPELAYIHPRERPDWEETISAMARSAEIPELRAEPLMRSSSSSTASMKVKNVKKLCFTKGHFPKLAECAHFHYENVDFGTIQLTLGDEQCEVTRNGYESKELVYLVHIYCQGRSWIVKRSYEDFRVLDKHLHLCIYDRRFSQLPELPRLDSLTDQSESVSQMLLAYLSRLSSIADNKINCGPALTWMEVDNKGNHLLVHEESSINVPAIAAAHVIKRYIAQASDELSFEVGDIVSVIDMPPKEDTTWWRGKHGFQVGFFPSECVELINDKVPQSMTNSVPKPASPCSGLPPASWSLFPPYLEMESVIQDSSWVADPLNHYSISSVSKKHGKLITFLRTFMKSRPTKQKLKQRGILRERVFGCDLGEHLLNSGHDVPQVLKSCTEFIEKHGVVDGIYRLSGIASNIQKLRHEFDSEQIPDLTKDVYIQDIHCVGSLCKLYFRELPNPLLTYQLYEKFSDAVSAATDEERLIKIHDVIQQLPPPHYRTLEFLMRHLSRLAAFSYITNMHSKNLAIVWAPNLLRSKQIESACFSGTAAFMEVRIQSVVVEFILNHVDVLFSTKLSSLIREGAGHNSLSRPKSLLVSSPSTKLLSLEEAQARTQAQINSPVTEDSKYIEVGEGPAALQGKFHTVIEFPTERKRPPIKTKKSPVGSWRSFFNLGKSSSMSKRKLHRNPSEPNELKAMALSGGRGDTATLRSAKSEESLSSLHNVEGESKMYRPRRPRSSSDALSASFNGELLDSRQHCNSYDNLDATEDSDADDGPICVPALISPPRLAGEDVDLSPPDIGMASLDFDPMSFQCSIPDTTYSFPLEDSVAGAECSLSKRKPGSREQTSSSDLISSSYLGNLSSSLLSTEFSKPAGEKPETKKLTTSYSYSDKPTQAVSPIKCLKTTTLTPFSTPELFTVEMSEKNSVGKTLPPPLVSKDSSPLMGSVLLRATEPSLSEAFQMELNSKLAAFDSVDGPESKAEERDQLALASTSQEPQVSNPTKDFSPQSQCSTAPVSAPPPPPPKNAARMLALALAESAQQVSLQPHPQCSEAATPVSKVEVEVSATQDTPSLAPLPQTHFDNILDQASSLPPAASTQSASCYSSNSSHPLAQQTPSSTILRPASSTTPPETDFSPPDTPQDKFAPPSASKSLVHPSTKSPDQEVPAKVPTPTSTSQATTPRSGCSESRVAPQSASEMKPEETTAPPVLPKPTEVPPLKPKKPVIPLPQHQPQPQPLLTPQCQTKTQPPPSNTSARTAPGESSEKPWEAIKPIQPCAGSSKYPDSHGSAPPAPPVRTMESKLATAALSQSEASFHVLVEGHPDEVLPQRPLTPRKTSTPQPPYVYHKGDPVLLEPSGGAYYHQRPVPLGPQGMPHHYRPEVAPPHHAYVSKSEPQIPYSARVDNRYSTLGPRSYHHSIKSRGNPRNIYMAPGPGHQGYSHDRTHGYPTIRRVHSLHVPSTIRTVPIHRTEVPPDDDMFFYHRPVYPCKAYQQAPPHPPQQSSQTDYHVTQLQPFFENGRVQYRYSPYSGSSPMEAPFYDIDPYGTIRVRHIHSYGGRDPATASRPVGKTGYHYLARHVIPPGKEHSFVSRDMPPGHASKEAPAYLSWDPEEAERLRMHSIRRESRARQKIKGPVLSQYDNVALFSSADMSGYETLHLRSKSDPGKAVLVAAESKDGRYLPRHLQSDPDVVMYMETDVQGHVGGDKLEGIGKQGSSKKCQSSHSLPSSVGLSQQQETKHEAVEEKLSGDSSHSKHRHQDSTKRSFQTTEHHQTKVKTNSYHSIDEQFSASREHVVRSKPERSHSVREQPHYNPSKPDLDRDYYQKHNMKPVQSHYDNLDDYHPVPHSQAPAQKRGGSSTYPAAGFPVSHNNNGAYATALGQGAFIQTELGLPRPEADLRTE